MRGEEGRRWGDEGRRWGNEGRKEGGRKELMNLL